MNRNGKRLWLVALRNALKLSQQDVAERAGISRTFYSDIENGTRTPSGKKALAISTSLGFDMALFFDTDYANRVYGEDCEHAATSA